ncbi:MAG: hypothetical protein IKZ96_00585 [Bacilli bacterium]|nr:hypothetical protein [Bacilli bacterium]
MKKILSSLIAVLVLVGSLLISTGCEKKTNTIEITEELGKGVFKVSVPKDAEGNPKYSFTKEKPSEISISSSFYLVTDTAVFGFSTSGLSYNTSKAYKEKYGETKASFDGYLKFIDDEELFNKKMLLPGLEQFDLNGRKALRYYNRNGSSGNYKYYGYFYMVGVDDIYNGSKAYITVNYKTDDKPTEIKEFDEETLAIINSIKIEPKTE